MVKKLSTIALAGLLALPATALAADIDELEEKVDQLSIVQFSGDFRSRLDSYKAEGVSGTEYENGTNMTNRLRLNIRAKATENVEFKGRLAYYKVWGMPSNVVNFGGLTSSDTIDGNVGRQPNDAALLVDRAFMNWNNIGGAPVWFSIGRRPTTDGPPNHLKMNNDKRMATPTAFMDWPFDGISLGWAYNNTGRVRFCWGRGFENGLQAENQANSTSDTDFAGFSWDIYKKADKLAYLQTFWAFNVFNYPQDYYDSYSLLYGSGFGLGPRANIGNLWHTSGVWMDKVADFNYFASLGWSQTQPGTGNQMLGSTGDENGYAIHIGTRYDLDDVGLKFGLEYNYGSEDWVAMTPGHDDLYESKLATRGSAWELYMIWDLPSGEAVSKFGKAFMRLGYIYYDYEYTGSGDWNLPPMDTAIDTSMPSLGYDPLKDANQIYLTMEMYF